MINSFFNHRCHAYGTAEMPQTRTPAHVYSEDFNRALGTDMTTVGWTWYQYLTEVGTFLTAAGNLGEVKTTVANWAGAFVLDAGLAWTDYTAIFEIDSYAGNRINLGFRHNGTTTYWMQCLPGVAVESKIYKASSAAFPGGASVLDTQTSPSPITEIKVVLAGTSIKLYYNGSATPTHDIVDATYGTGSIAVSAYQTGVKLKSIVID